MKCVQCGSELKPGAKFCTACGAKQPENEEKICPNCGAALQAGARFCKNCGGPVETSQPEAQPAQTAPQSPEKKNSKGKAAVIAVVAVVLVAGIAAAVWAATRPATKGDGEQPVSSAAGDTVVQPDQIDSADIDLVADDTVELTGTVRISTDNELFLDWGEPMRILLTDDDGERVQVSDVSSAYLVNDGVSRLLWEELPLDQPVRIEGELEIEGTRLYLYAEELTDTDGSALVIQAEQQPLVQQEEILPQSDSRLLTYSDIEGLTLQEINYAKNEIYARHGRKFSSKELQTYFASKSWYHGTIAPEDFSDSVLSDTERKNADFLAEVEFSIDPNGYKLDA